MPPLHFPGVGVAVDNGGGKGLASLELVCSFGLD
jgi:hypothetical protein